VVLVEDERCNPCILNPYSFWSFWHTIYVRLVDADVVHVVSW
jgi:hypothetical protein